MGAVDIVLTDLHYWEGPRGVKDLVAVCRTFNLGVAMHSGAEFGIELAAMLHTAATIPEMTFAGDAHYHYLTDDIIEGGLMKYETARSACRPAPASASRSTRRRWRSTSATTRRRATTTPASTRTRGGRSGIRLVGGM